MKLYCIGIGPGGAEQMTLRAVRALEACDCVAGYGLYLDLIAELIEGKTRIQTGMTREVDRCTAAREPTFEVMMMTVLRKSTLRPDPSVRCPSSKIWSMALKTSGCAFSISSNSTTA